MLNSQDYFDKHLLRLGGELRGLWRRRYIRVALDEPIQCGWRRFHVLTTKAERRADKAVLLALLEVIGTVQFRNTPEFRTKRGRGRRRRYFEIEQPLRELTLGEWQSRGLPEEWKPYFRHEKRCYFRVWKDALIFGSPYAFELKIEPNWITETYLCDPAVEERIAEIESWLWNHDAMPRLNWLCDISDRWRTSQRRDLLDKITRRELRIAVQNPLEVDPDAPMGRIRISFQRINHLRGEAGQKRCSVSRLV